MPRQGPFGPTCTERQLSLSVGRQPLPEYTQPINITTGPDGNLWFTELCGNKIGRITTDGAVSEFPIPTPYSTPWGIASGRGNKVWFAEANSVASNIGRINVK